MALTILFAALSIIFYAYVYRIEELKHSWIMEGAYVVVFIFSIILISFLEETY